MSKVAVITGASDGIGKEIANELARSGYELALVARNEERLRYTEAEAQKNGAEKVQYYLCDVANITAVEETVARIHADFGRIDILINNAGLWIEGKLEDNDPQQIHDILDVNTNGIILVAREVLPIMKAQGSGLIINTISQAGMYAKAERSVYTASKWAITGFTKALQNEVGVDGVRVTGIYPGVTKTDLFKKSGNEREFDAAIQPLDIAKAIAFICSLPDEVHIPELGIKHVKN